MAVEAAASVDSAESSENDSLTTLVKDTLETGSNSVLHLNMIPGSVPVDIEGMSTEVGQQTTDVLGQELIDARATIKHLESKIVIYQTKLVNLENDVQTGINTLNFYNQISDTPYLFLMGSRIWQFCFNYN